MEYGCLANISFEGELMTFEKESNSVSNCLIDFGVDVRSLCL